MEIDFNEAPDGVKGLQPIPPKTQKIQFILRSAQLCAEAAGGEFNDVPFGALFDAGCRFVGDV